MPLKTDEAKAWVRATMRADLSSVAGPGGRISRDEQAAMPAGLLRDAVAAVRANGGPGARVSVDDAFAVADGVATSFIDANNLGPPHNLSKTDIIYLAGAHHGVAVLVAAAYRALTGGRVVLPPAPDPGPGAPEAGMLSWLETRVRGDLAAAAGNGTISRAEEAAMPSGLAKDAVAAARVAGSGVGVDAALERAWSRATDALYRHDRVPVGALSASEVRAIAAYDPAVGALFAQAFRALTGTDVDRW